MPEPTRDILTLAVPKGRVLKQLARRLEPTGLDAAVLLKDDRRLVRVDEERGLRFLLLKPDDVPTYVEYGAADVGIVGRDVLLERAYDLYVPLDLGIGRCKMSVAGLEGREPHREDLRPLRVATKFPHIASQHYARQGRQVELVFVQGSVELAPITGLADVIVDLVETGETLRQNGLEVIEDIVQVSSVLVANRAAMKLKAARIDALIDAFRKTS